jgi:hypothetical protein
VIRGGIELALLDKHERPIVHFYSIPIHPLPRHLNLNRTPFQNKRLRLSALRFTNLLFCGGSLLPFYSMSCSILMAGYLLCSVW